MSGALQAVFQNQRSFLIVTGQQAFTSSGSFTWVAPAGVTKVSVLAVGGGAGGGGNGGGGGGGLGYKNNYSVTSGCSYCLTVGNGGVTSFGNATASFFVSTGTVRGGGGLGGCAGGTFTGDGGGNGGNSEISGTGITTMVRATWALAA